jgi:hypothetical protein
MRNATHRAHFYEGTSESNAVSCMLISEQTLNELCQLQANWFDKDNPSSIKAKRSTDQPAAISSGATSKGNTFRAHVPINTTKEALQHLLQDHGVSRGDVQVLSICPCSPTQACATFSIPEVVLPQVPLPKEVTLDDDFEGITPLYDAGRDKAVVE